MREDHTNTKPVDTLPVSTSQLSSKSPDRYDHPPNGFTAVNGDSQGGAPFRPVFSARESMTPRRNDHDSSQRNVPSEVNSHGWRPAGGPFPESVSLSKRKRSISIDVNGNGKGNGKGDEHGEDRAPYYDGQTFKRRMTSTLDSAIDLTSPVTTANPQATTRERRPAESVSVGRYTRRRSPVGQGQPPPKPSSRSTDRITESVDKFWQQEAQRTSEAVDQRASPEHDNEQGDDQLSPTEEAHDNNSDPKKPRKRNFSTRTKSGCHTCRGRKKKCDEGRPVCVNCEKGGFICTGYGPKPPNGTKGVPGRALAVQPKGYETPQGHVVYHEPANNEAGRSYSHWGRVPESESHRAYESHAVVEQRHPPSREGWGRQSWTPHEVQGPHHYDRYPGVDLPGLPPPHPIHLYPGAALAPLPPSHPSHNIPMPDPFAPHEPVEPYHRPSHGPPTAVSSHSSGPTHNSQHTAHLALQIAGFPPSEKDKMMRGQPFLHWLDNFLIGERDSCSIALDRYNKGARSDGGISREEKAKLFAQVLDPQKRRHFGGQPQPQSSPSPIGTINDRTIVESPFKCDYGYNIHIGACTVLQAGCYLQDAASITIGDRVIVGPDVKIHCLTANIDPTARKGGQGHVVAGAVTIEDDVFIGASALILPYCTVGRGSVVGAGSVVTKDVPEYTVMAGNPAKIIRRIEQGASSERRHAYEIQERNDRVKKRMVEYANSGYNVHSPRMI